MSSPLHSQHPNRQVNLPRITLSLLLHLSLKLSSLQQSPQKSKSNSTTWRPKSPLKRSPIRNSKTPSRIWKGSVLSRENLMNLSDLKLEESASRELIMMSLKSSWSNCKSMSAESNWLRNSIYSRLRRNLTPLLPPLRRSKRRRSTLRSMLKVKRRPNLMRKRLILTSRLRRLFLIRFASVTQRLIFLRPKRRA